jgi:selenoprotein W-related protein
LAAVLKEEVGVDAEYIKSGGGVFEVVADDDLIFSKKAEKRFPEDSEIVEALRARI